MTFRHVPRAGGLERANRINKALVDQVRRDGRIFLSSTLIDGRFMIRVAVLPFRTHLHTIDRSLDVLRELVEA